MLFCFVFFSIRFGEAAEHKIWWCQFHPFDVWHPKQMPYSAFVTLLSDSISQLFTIEQYWFCRLKQLIQIVNSYRSLVTCYHPWTKSDGISLPIFFSVKDQNNLLLSDSISALDNSRKINWFCGLKQTLFLVCILYLMVRHFLF